MIELDNFRKKYPQYNDMSDIDLANSLANKYPAYKDLTSRIGTEQPTQQQQPQQQKPSMLGTIAKAAFPGSALFQKETWQPLSQTFTGKSLTQRSQEIPISAKMTGNKFMDTVSAVGAGVGAFQRDVAASAVDMATTPANYLGGAVVGVAPKIIKGTGKLVAAPFKATGRFFARIKNRLSPEEIPNINVNPKQRVSDLAAKSRGQFSQESGSISKEISDINIAKGQSVRELGYQAKDLKVQTSQAINESRMVLKKNLQVLGDDLKNASEKGSLEFQEKLPEFFKANGEAYADRLDAIADDLITQGRGITRKQVTELIQKTKNDLAESLVPEGPATSAINSLEQKYVPQMIGQANKFISSKTGEGVGGALRSNADDFVDFQELVQDIRNVRKSLSGTAKSGSTGFAQEDLAVQFLNNNLGSYVKQFSPEFAQLQKDYTPVIRGMKASYKIFKPTQGIYKSEGGAAFLRRAGSGKTRAGESELLSTLEGGTPFAQGVGNVSQTVKNVGGIQKQIKEEVAQGPAKLRDALVKQLRTIEEKKRALVDTSDKAVMAKRKILEQREASLTKRLNDLEKRRQKATQLLANKQKATTLRNAFLAGAGAAGGITAAIKLGD